MKKLFESNPNKDAIRIDDAVTIENYWKEKKSKLNYFGLTGPSLADLLEWRDYLNHAMVVERRNPIAIQLLLDAAFNQNFDNKLQVLVGDIDDVMIHWVDEFGCLPRFEHSDLVNLDYIGGIMHKGKLGKSKRVDAIRSLIRRQSSNGSDFLLLMTVNARTHDLKELDFSLSDIEKSLKDYHISASGVIQWYQGQGYDWKLKVYVPYLLDGIAAANGFLCESTRPITYIGTGNVRMVHFGFAMHYDKRMAGKARGKSLVDIVNLQMREAHNGKISISKTEPPRLGMDVPSHARRKN